MPAPRPRPADSPAVSAVSATPAVIGLALDTLGSFLRCLGEFALPHGETDVETFRQNAESWARHVTLATQAPGAAPETAASEAGRRDWEGVRRFVRGYCEASSQHAKSVVADLRETLWVFIRNLHQALVADSETDAELKARLGRLETLAQAAAASDLKREVLEAAKNLGQLLEAREKRHRSQMELLGDRVRRLGSELETARRDGETDPLTALANRKAFDEYLARTLEICGAFGQDATLLLIDLDHFKSINDGHGHTSGDETLRQVANAIVRVFLRKNDFCARYGGDELAVILRETPAKEAEALAARVLRGVRALTIPGPQGLIKPTVSIGIGGYATGDDVRRWIDRADRGLYAAKQAGRNGSAIGQ